MQWINRQISQQPVWLLALLTTLTLILFTYPFEIKDREAKRKAELDFEFNKVFFEVENTFHNLESFFLKQDELSAQCTPQVLKTLRSAHFHIPFIAEFGILDKNGKLTCTSWEKVTPPIQANRAPEEYGLRFFGPTMVSYMEEVALVISKTRSDGSEINALIPQPVMKMILNSVQSKQGYIAIVDSQVGVPVFLNGKYTLPLSPEDRVFPLQTGRKILKTQFDDQSTRYFIAERFPSLNRLSLVMTREKHTPDWALYMPGASQFITWLIFFGGIFYLIHDYRKRYLSLTAWIRSGIEQDEFINHYQPVINSVTGEITGVESLVRWQHPVDGMIPPFAFIPEAESNGLIVPMTYNIIRHARRDLAPILAERPDFKVNINITGKHLKDTDFIDFVLKSQQEIHRLTLELTETELIEFDDPAVSHNLKRLRERGITMAVDDFGTGYAGLQYLQQLPLDILKIDQSFVSVIGTESPRSKVLEAIISLSHELSLVIIAEGVETEEQAAYLNQKGVIMHQGWLYSKALPANEITQFRNTVPPSVSERSPNNQKPD